ncbi:hypothetical protein HY970_01830 [Candidatus Kaiserbacteria bacterium]|nr:hypothetical protein [Candidatus Kaiserbacteria bacterium]
MDTVIPRQCLAVFDYDGTTADTAAPSPNGVTVTAAYSYALMEMFGVQDLLEEIGGLQNRTPRELIEDIVAGDRHLRLRTCGRRYFETHRDRLWAMLPTSRNRRPRHSGLIDTLTETLVRVKLSYLLDEIGHAWPKPFDGVLDTFEAMRRDGTAAAIVSSGHECFIRKSFEFWGVPCPNVLLTDDDCRAYDIDPKPNAGLIDLMLALSHRYRTSAAPILQKRNIIGHFGDCEIKDGGLAANAGVPFFWFNRANRKPRVSLPENTVVFSDWRTVSDGVLT